MISETHLFQAFVLFMFAQIWFALKDVPLNICVIKHILIIGKTIPNLKTCMLTETKWSDGKTLMLNENTYFV